MVAKRMEQVEERQDKQEEQLTKHEDAIKKNSQKVEEGEKKMKKLEDQMEKKDQNSFDMRQCNAVAILFNVPEAKEEEEENDRKKDDWLKVKNIFQELGMGEIQPLEASRIGKTGKYPRKIQLTLSREECERVVKKGWEGPALADNIFLMRDRMYNQRQEARLFRVEKEKEELTQPERGRGRGRGRP